MSDERKVVTLLAEKGKKYDEDCKCISSYDGSIVFLPADVLPGVIVRVSLHEVTEKKDSRGAVMYFARHAPAPVSDDVLEQIRCEANVLGSMSDFDETTALALLRARHGTVVDAWKGYRNYYFDESGAVYASCFPPAILSLLENLKRGSGATEPLLWVLGDMRETDDSLFRTRERGEEIDWRFSVPPMGDVEIEQLEAKVADCKLLLSDPLIEMRSGTLYSEGWTDQLWQKASWPTLSVPDFEGGDDVPDIMEYEYGKGLDGQPLLGYSVFGPSNSAWYKNRVEAEKAHLNQVDELNRLRTIWRTKEEMLPAMEVLNKRRKVVGLPELICQRDKVLCDDGFSLLGGEYSKEVLALFEQETASKEAEEAQTAMEEAMREAQKRAEAETTAKAEYEASEHKADIQCREASGGIIRNLRVWVHTSSQAGDAGAFVVNKSGELRSPDHDEYERSHGRGAHHVIWDLVEESEGVVEWAAGSSSTQRIPTLPVRKKPVNGWTPAQLKTLGTLERELGVDISGGWLVSIKYRNQSVPKQLGASLQELEALADWFNK